MPDEREKDEFGRLPGAEAVQLERQLRTALQRVEAPDGFTDRLMARVASLPAGQPSAPARNRRRGVLLRLTTPAWRFAYGAAALVAVTAGAVHVEQVRSEQRKADVAAAKFDTALQVTNRALDQVSAKLEKTEFGAVQRALEANGGDQ